MTEQPVTAIEAADVWKGDSIAGQLRRRGDDTVFSYGEGYASAGGRRVAHSLPLTDADFTAVAGAVPPFFAGLLPEGERLLALTRRVKTSTDDMFSLLLAVGGDPVGDVRVVPHGIHPDAVTPAVTTGSWADADFDELFARSVGIEPDDGDRVALAGVQEKVSAGVITFPVVGENELTQPSILKLSPQRYPRLVENEDWCLDLAAACGLKVAEHQVVHDGRGRSALLVRRFDRVWDAGQLRRLEQEDAAQLAGRFPGHKYRMRSIEVARVVGETVHAQRLAMREFLALIAVSYLVGNGDLHAKNVSVLTRPDAETVLAPAYDLVSTVAYLPNDVMALEFEGRNNRLRRADFVAFGARVGVPERAVNRRLDEIVDVVEEWTARVGQIGLDERTTARVERTMRERLADVRRPAGR